MQIQFSQSRPQDVRLVAQVTDKGKVPAGLEKSLVEGMETARFKGTVGQVFEGFVERGGQVLRLALAGAGKGAAAQAMSDRFAKDARQTGDMANRIADPGLAALAGLNAFAEGRYGDAFGQLCAARPRLQTIGGSHAQRDVFERMTIDAGLRAGHFLETEQILLERLNLRAGHEDRFAATRFEHLERVRRIPAQ